MTGESGSESTQQDSAENARRALRIDWGIAVAASAASLLVYLPSLSVLPGSGDGAEFQVLAHQFGVTHAPGHAVYITLAKVATLLPIGSVAYRVNLLSAFGAASALAAVFLGARAAGASRAASLIGSVTLGSSLTFWSHAVVAEVYTLGAAFLAIVWASLFGWDRTKNARLLFVAGVAGALGAGVDTGVALQAPACALFVCQRRGCDAHAVVTAVGGAAAGAGAVALALVAAVLHTPPANVFDAIYRPASSQWGLSVEYFSRFGNQVHFIATAKPWRFAMFQWDLVWTRAHEYLMALPSEFGAAGLLLIVVGAVVISQTNRSLTLTFAIALAVCWLFTWTYHVPDIAGFYVPGYVVFALIATKGADAILQWCVHRTRSAPVVAGAAIVGLLVVGASMRWARVDRYAVPYQRIVAIVDHLPEDAIVLSPWLELYTFYYAAQVDRSRWDLRFVELAPFGEHGHQVPRSTFDLLSAEANQRPVFLSTPSYQVEREGYDLSPTQLGPRTLFRVTRR
jgi:hypothetical protein